MSIQFKHEVQDKLLLITTEGKDDSLKEVENYARSILELAVKHNCSQVLCDERNLLYSISMGETLKYAESLAADITQVNAIAVVCDKRYLNEGEVFELAARGRGLSVLATSDYQEAISWLNT